MLRLRSILLSFPVVRLFTLMGIRCTSGYSAAWAFAQDALIQELLETLAKEKGYSNWRILVDEEMIVSNEGRCIPAIKVALQAAHPSGFGLKEYWVHYVLIPFDSNYPVAMPQALSMDRESSDWQRWRQPSYKAFMSFLRSSIAEAEVEEKPKNDA